MDVSGVLRFASEKGLALDGFDVRNMFPGKTNWRELEGASEAASPTWLLLKLQARRYLLNIAHTGLYLYSTLPHIWMSPLGSLSRLAMRSPESPMHYSNRKCTKSELQSLNGGPRVIAVPLKLDFVAVPSLEEPPESKKLADGTILEPSKADHDEYKRICEAKIEAYYHARQKALDSFLDRMCDLVEWAVLSPSVKKLIIYEQSGTLSEHTRSAHDAIQNRVATIPPSLQRDVLCSFPGSPLDSGDLHLIWCDETQKPVSEPDLLILFDGFANGYPFETLKGVDVFVPSRRQILEEGGINLLDYIQAVKFYLGRRSDNIDVSASGIESSQAL